MPEAGAAKAATPRGARLLPPRLRRPFGAFVGGGAKPPRPPSPNPEGGGAYGGGAKPPAPPLRAPKGIGWPKAGA